MIIKPKRVSLYLGAIANTKINFANHKPHPHLYTKAVFLHTCLVLDKHQLISLLARKLQSHLLQQGNGTKDAQISQHLAQPPGKGLGKAGEAQFCEGSQDLIDTAAGLSSSIVRVFWA